MSAKQKDVGSSLALDQIFCACYFGFVRLFFANLFWSPKGPPSVFLILQKNGCLKNPKGPPFYIFWHCATYRRLRKKIRNFQFFERFSCLQL